MAREDGFEPTTPTPEHRASTLDVSERPPQAFGIWLTTRDVMHFVPCTSVDAARQWLRRHGIRHRNNGSVARLDVERELRRRKPRRVMHPNSIRNLRGAVK